MINVKLGKPAEGLMTEQEFHRAEHRRELFLTVLSLVFDLCSMVVIFGLACLGAAYWLLYEVGLWAMNWAVYTAAVATLAYCVGTQWQRIKDWMF